MKVLLSVALGVLVALGLAIGAASADQPNPLTDPAAFVNYVDATVLLAGTDPAAIASVFTEDLVWEGGTCDNVGGTCVGLDALKRALAIRGPVQQIQVTDVQASGTTIRSRIEVRSPSNPSAIASGVDRWILNRAWDLRGDKIAPVRVTFDTSDPQTARYVAARQQRLAAQGVTSMPSSGGGGAAATWRGLGLLGLLLLGGGVTRLAGRRGT